MAYVKKTLAQGEKVISEGRFHWTYSLISWAWLLGAGLLGVGIVIFFARQAKKWTTELVVTNRRFVYKRGILALKTDEFNVSRIQAITVTQTWVGRLFGYGHLNIRGEEIGQFGLPAISDPLTFRRALIAAAEIPEKPFTPRLPARLLPTSPS